MIDYFRSLRDSISCLLFFEFNFFLHFFDGLAFVDLPPTHRISFANFIDPIIVFLISSVYHNFFQFLLIHLISLVCCEVLILLFLPCLNQFFKVIIFLYFFGKISCFQFLSWSSIYDLIDLFIYNIAHDRIWCEEYIRHFKDWLTLFGIPKYFEFWRLIVSVGPESLTFFKIISKFSFIFFNSKYPFIYFSFNFIPLFYILYRPPSCTEWSLLFFSLSMLPEFLKLLWRYWTLQLILIKVQIQNRLQHQLLTNLIIKTHRREYIIEGLFFLGHYPTLLMLW